MRGCNFSRTNRNTHEMLTINYNQAEKEIRALGREFCKGSCPPFTGKNLLTQDIIRTFKMTDDLDCELSTGLGIFKKRLLGITFRYKGEQVSGWPSRCVHSLEDARYHLDLVKKHGLQTPKEEDE